MKFFLIILLTLSSIKNSTRIIQEVSSHKKRLIQSILRQRKNNYDYARFHRSLLLGDYVLRHKELYSQRKINSHQKKVDTINEYYNELKKRLKIGMSKSDFKDYLYTKNIRELENLKKFTRYYVKNLESSIGHKSLETDPTAVVF